MQVKMNKPVPMSGELLANRYAMIEPLHDTEMSNLYRAEDRQTNMQVVIKIPTAYYASGIYLKRFVNASKFYASLNHPNICMLHDFGMCNQLQRPYAVFPYLEGPTLQEVIGRDGPLSPEKFGETFAAICDALQHAHECDKAIVHRSLKPDHIIMSTVDGQTHPFIIDFFLADALNDPSSKELWQMGEVVGFTCDMTDDTANSAECSFMSPEHCMGHKIVPTSEIYSLGCCMYYALTGESPFLGNTVIDTMQKHMSERIPNGKLPPNFEPILLKALEKNPDARYQSMADLKDALLKAQPHQNKKKLGFSLSRPIKE